jgi:glycerol kinase
MDKYILALDQGTTSSRAIIFDFSGSIISVAQKEFPQYYPQPGWVEHDPNEIWSSQAAVMAEALAKANLEGFDIATIGITNQRETTIVWDRLSGEPIYNGIVWQDRRTSDYCRQLKEAGYAETIKLKTGLMIDAYFSGTKIKWILDNVKGARDRAEAGELAFGTVDSWLVWKLTNGKKHLTDETNASRTMLYNIHSKKWDDELLRILDIPGNICPEVHSSSEIYGYTIHLPGASVPISGIAGDQQAALFGQMCFHPGMIKNTYGTGAFLIFNTGKSPFESKNNLLTTIGWNAGGETYYALEGSIFIAGAVVQWLRDGLGIISASVEVESLSQTVEDNGGVFFVPAFAGLGAPHWDQFARGSIFGITRGTTDGHIARAALESIAFQTLDVVQAMQADSGIKIKELRVDGGATVNDSLMQFQADILGIPIIRPKISETTALGAAYLAGLAIDYWKGYKDIENQWQIEKTFYPKKSENEVKRLTEGWQEAVKRTKGWIK